MIFFVRTWTGWTGGVKFLLKSDITFHLNYSCFRQEVVGAADMKSPACGRPCIIKMQIESVPGQPRHTAQSRQTNGAMIPEVEKYFVSFLS